MTEEPIPDLLDHGGRLRRIGVSAAVATLIAVVAASITYGLARSDIERGTFWGGHSTASAWRFVFFFTALAWVLAFVAVHWFLVRRDKKRNPFVPQAVVRRHRSS